MSDSNEARRYVAGHGLLIGALALLSWLGEGWGYLVLYGCVVATLAAGVGIAWGWLVRRSPPRASAFVARILRSFVFAQATLAAALLATAVLARNMDGPLGPFPGGPFQGQAAPGPLPEDLVIPPEGMIQMQVPAPTPYTINVHGFVLDGCLHVGADFVFPFKRWVDRVHSGERVIVRIGEELFDVRAARVADPATSHRVLEQVSEARGVNPEDWLTEVWFFRLGCER